MLLENTVPRYQTFTDIVPIGRYKIVPRYQTFSYCTYWYVQNCLQRLYLGIKPAAVATL